MAEPDEDLPEWDEEAVKDMWRKDFPKEFGMPLDDPSIEEEVWKLIRKIGQYEIPPYNVELPYHFVVALYLRLDEFERRRKRGRPYKPLTERLAEARAMRRVKARKAQLVETGTNATDAGLDAADEAAGQFNLSATEIADRLTRRRWWQSPPRKK
jgi:hypothetical protein